MGWNADSAEWWYAHGYDSPVSTSEPPFGWASEGGAGPVSVPDPAGPPSPDYAVSLEIAYPYELNRWLPLVKWLLAIPHFVALFFVGIGAFFVVAALVRLANGTP